MAREGAQGGAESVFADYVGRADPNPAAFEFLCREHPKIEAELRTLYSDWVQFERIAPALVSSLDGSVFARPGVARAAASTTSARFLGAGSQVGGYRLLQKIGEGGMGSVWEAEDSSLGRRVAVKLLRPDRSGERALELFEREARAGARLRHRGIVAVHSFGTDDDLLFIVQELVANGRTLADSLGELRKRADLPDGYYRQVAELFVQLCEALQVAHDHDVLHRDLKPQNVLLDTDGSPKVSDFGLARLVGDAGLTVTGEVMGTPLYMSPEQAQGRQEAVGPASDVFSLGVVLYEALTLRRAFEGDTPHQVLAQVVAHEPPLARRIRSRVPRELELICAKAMSKEIGGRYASMNALRDDLRRFLEQRPIAARPPGVVERSWKWARRHPTSSSLLALGLLSVMGITFVAVKYLLATRDAVAARERVERLADLKRVDDLVAEADDLWPITGDLAERCDHWLAAVAPLEDRLPLHEATLSELQRAAAAKDSPGPETAVEWHRQALAQLIREMRSLLDREDGLSADVVRRRQLSEAVTATIREPLAQSRWANAGAAIENSPLYDGLVLTPQAGLVPLGPDPETSLWEFGHVVSGEVARRGEDGRLQLDTESGIVLVLVPGGRFTMGTRLDEGVGKSYHELPNFRGIMEREVPVHEVELEPFFLSKYELTQAQWTEFTGENPSQLRPGSRGMPGRNLHPVETVNWRDSQTIMQRMGLTLPTEAQWEFATRAGTTTAWWTGDDYRTLAETANIGDASTKIPSRETAWNDEYVDHAPVGRFLPNPFGLHDVYGNVWEWCADTYESYTTEPRSGDGLRTGTSELRVARGGGYTVNRVFARSGGARDSRSEDYVNPAYGIRSARRVDPSDTD